MAKDNKNKKTLPSRDEKGHFVKQDKTCKHDKGKKGEQVEIRIVADKKPGEKKDAKSPKQETVKPTGFEWFSRTITTTPHAKEFEELLDIFDMPFSFFTKKDKTEPMKVAAEESVLCDFYKQVDSKNPDKLEIGSRTYYSADCVAKLMKQTRQTYESAFVYLVKKHEASKVQQNTTPPANHDINANKMKWAKRIANCIMVAACSIIGVLAVAGCISIITKMCN